MDRGFKDRVDKVFASIASSSSSWSLTGVHVDKRAWNRDKRYHRDDDDETLISSNFFNCQGNRRKGIDDLSDDDGQIGDEDGVQTENDGDEWDIRSSIGLDSALDNEEEEDAYDKMAEGRESGGDRLYMKDVIDHGPYLNSHNILPSSVQDVKKDPRANHDAAKTRLKEDETMLVTVPASSEDGIRIKSILKRKSDGAVKRAKRVRFDSTCKNDDELTNTIQQQQGFGVAKASENGHKVPDYILNPSNYTRYDFDDISNDEAYMGFLKQSGESSAVDLPRSVPFIPRKRRGKGEGEAAGNIEGQVKQSSTQVGFGIAALEDEVQRGEIIEMQEDESHAVGICTKSRFQKPGRRYRSKIKEDEDVG